MPLSLSCHFPDFASNASWAAAAMPPASVRALSRIAL
jgi:hypothetical protein